jgi:hypothetical protein
VKLADVDVVPCDFLSTKQYQRQTAISTYDLVVYDRCRPEAMPQANTFFIAAMPPGDVWKATGEVGAPAIIDMDPSHPLMQWVSLGDVMISSGTPLEVPPGGSVLIDSQFGPMLVIAPRGGFEDAVLACALIDEREDEGGKKARYFGTNWPCRPSFPVFVINLLEYLGGARANLGGESLRPGEPVELEGPTPDKPLEVRTPTGRTHKLNKAQRGKFHFAGTSELGVYEVRCQGQRIRRFVVNLFDRSESDIVPGTEIQLPVSVAGQTSGWESDRKEIWKGLLLLGLAVLCLEWYIYNRRVYV